MVGGEVWEGPGRLRELMSHRGDLDGTWGNSVVLSWRVLGPSMCFRRITLVAGQKSDLLEVGTRVGQEDSEEAPAVGQVSNEGGPDQGFQPQNRDRASQREKPSLDQSLWTSAGPQAADLWPGCYRGCHQISLASVSLSVTWGKRTHAP